MKWTLALLAALAILVQGEETNDNKAKDAKTSEKFISLFGMDPEIEEQANLGKETRKDMKNVGKILVESALGIPFPLDLMVDGIKKVIGIGLRGTRTKPEPAGDDELDENESTEKKRMDKLKKGRE